MSLSRFACTIFSVSTDRALAQYARGDRKDIQAVVLGQGTLLAGDSRQLEEQLIPLMVSPTTANPSNRLRFVGRRYPPKPHP
jgi:hypothetical protein